MSTKFTEKVVVNAPGSDVVFDGCDFTGNAYIEVTAAKSVSLRNCRIYRLASQTSGNNYFMTFAKDIECKLVVERCFFGNNPMDEGTLYNLIEGNLTVADGSSVSNNYFTMDCASHNDINFYAAAEGAAVKINDNVFEDGMGPVRLGMRYEPTCTFDISNNKILSLSGYPEYEGVVCVQPFAKQTTSFANCTITMNKNEHPANRYIYGYSGANDTMLDETTAPTVYIDGVKTDLEITH